MLKILNKSAAGVPAKKYNYFDQTKSLVENLYYVLMILSIVFVAIQVIIARDSLDHSANMQLAQHTVEQNNRYRVSIEAAAEEFVARITSGTQHPVSMTRVDSIIMQQDNLELMSPDELMAMMPFTDSIMADAVEMERLVQLQLDLATEMEQYAFFVLNGYLFEHQAYNDLGNTFLRSTNLGAMPVIYMLSYRNLALYHIDEFRHIRPLYDIWWHRKQIERCENRIAICRTILDGDERGIEFLTVAGAAEISLSREDLLATIRQTERERAELERTLSEKLRAVPVRN